MASSDEEFARKREQLLSEGHNPPRFVDRRLPTYETGVFADGGPAKVGGPRQQGTNPWILGSFTLGSNKIWMMDQYKFQTSSPNVWFKLRHGHSGTASVPGGTLDSWHMTARGALGDRSGNSESPLHAVRGPGTIFLYGFGAGSVSGTSSNRVHRALGTRGVDRFSGLVRGYVV